MTFSIYSVGGRLITTLDEWSLLAPPAGRARQWKAGRSAQELARRWVSGALPGEVQHLLRSQAVFRGFVPLVAHAEHKTPIDSYRGNTRNHDLLVIGRTPNGPAVLDIEGKVDEPFGPTVAEQSRTARRARTDNPRSRALERLNEICWAVVGAPPETVGHLRYQLLHGVAAAAIAAAEREARCAAWIVHELRTPSADPAALQRNARDLAAFIEHLNVPQRPVSRGTEASLVGPFRLPGGGRVPAGAELYIGKAVGTGSTIVGPDPAAETFDQMTRRYPVRRVADPDRPS